MKGLLHSIPPLLLAVSWVWTCGAFLTVAHLHRAIVLALLVAWPLAFRQFPQSTTWTTVSLLLVFMLVVFGLHRPLQDRAWGAPYSRLPKVSINEKQGLITVDDIRDFVWQSSTKAEERWTKEEFDLNQLDRLDLVIEPFLNSNYFAHAMLSFGFGPSKRIVVSVEARRQIGEPFGLLPGLYRQFEMIYQINTERDAFTWRTTDPQSNLYVVPINAELEFMRKLFIDMMREAHSLESSPKFYHSFISNCTTALFDHMNDHLPKRVRYGREVFFSAQAPALLDRLGWIVGDTPWPQGKDTFRSADNVRQFATDPHFSQKIREEQSAKVQSE